MPHYTALEVDIIHYHYFNVIDFTKLIGVCHMPVQLKQEIISTVLKSSFAIYSNRNNAAMINDA